jgi:hypothetical protein
MTALASGHPSSESASRRGRHDRHSTVTSASETSRARPRGAEQAGEMTGGKTQTQAHNTALHSNLIARLAQSA